MHHRSSKVREPHSVADSLWPAAGALIADALSMPVHWYYSVTELKRDFGRITDYQAPKARHPGDVPSQPGDRHAAAVLMPQHPRADAMMLSTVATMLPHTHHTHAALHHSTLPC